MIMSKLIFRPSTLTELEKFSEIVRESPFYGEWDDREMGFVFEDERDYILDLKDELELLSQHISGYFIVE